VASTSLEYRLRLLDDPGQRAAIEGNPDARHLVWLREELGEHFITGAVPNTGPLHYRARTTTRGQ